MKILAQITMRWPVKYYRDSCGNGNNTTAAPGTTDANGTGNDGTVSGELGDSVKDLGDGVGNAVDDIGNAVGNAVEGR